MIELESGMRVRCVDAYGTRLRKGREYTVESTMGDYVSVVGEKYWHRHRFKPVIRVKAKSEPVVTEGSYCGLTQYDAGIALVFRRY